MKNLSNLNTKDKMLILKAIIDKGQNAYKSNTQFVINQLVKNGENYSSDYGMFWTKTTKAKTVQEVIDENYEKIKKLQDEIATLGTIADKSTIVKEETITLMSKHSAEADSIADELLEGITDTLDSKRITKAASKVKRG